MLQVKRQAIVKRLESRFATVAAVVR